MGKIAIWILVAIAIMLVLRLIAAGKKPPAGEKPGGGQAGGAGSRGNRDDREQRGKAGELMMSCAVCGVHLPSSEAVFAHGKVFCGTEHRDVHEAGRGDG